MSTDITEVKMLLMRPPPQPQPQETAAALALHRAIDAAEKMRGGSSAHPVMLFLSGLGLLALGAGVTWVVLH